MMETLIPMWIIGGPFIGLLILAFSFKGPSAMSGGPGIWYGDRDAATRKTTVSY
jgi:hypothetical protein